MSHPDSKYTHALCPQCYSEVMPGRVPTQVKDADEEVCCRCRVLTTDGIYWRGEPFMKSLCWERE